MVATRIEGNTGELMRWSWARTRPRRTGVPASNRPKPGTAGSTAPLQGDEGASSTNSKTPVDALLPKNLSHSSALSWNRHRTDESGGLGVAEDH